MDINNTEIVLNTTTYQVTLSPIEVLYFTTETRLWIYIGWVIMALGTLGHILTLIIILTKRDNRSNSSGVYITALSLAGLASLYIGLLRFIIFAQSNWTINLKDLSNSSCKIHTALSYLSLQYVAWLQATIAVDRALAVTRPHWYKRACTWRKALAVALVEVALCIGLHIGILFRVGINEKGICTPSDKRWFKVWPYIDFLSFSAIPATIILTCNTIILLRIVRCKLPINKSAPRRRRSITSMLVSVNVAFLITTIPISVIYFIEWNTNNHYQLSLLYSIFSLLQYFGIASTFLIYCLSGSKFRAQLKRMLSGLRKVIRKKTKKPESNFALQDTNYHTGRKVGTMTTLTYDITRNADSSSSE